MRKCVIQHTVLKDACRKELDEDEAAEEARSLPDRREKPEQSPDEGGLWDHLERILDIVYRETFECISTWHLKA